jgi:hypothetical protein
MLQEDANLNTSTDTSKVEQMLQQQAGEQPKIHVHVHNETNGKLDYTTKKGYVYKLGYNNGKWQRRFLTLNESTLVYFQKVRNTFHMIPSLYWLPLFSFMMEYIIFFRKLLQSLKEPLKLLVNDNTSCLQIYLTRFYSNILK